jgi:hypothetical protein
MPMKSLSVFRVFSGIFFLTLYSPFFFWIGNVPQAFFYPPLLSLSNLFSGFPQPLFFIVLDLLITVGFVFIALGIRAKAAGILTSVLIFIGYNFNFSIGKIDHNILALAFLFMFSFSGWGSELSLLPDRKVKPETKNKITSLFAVFLCFGMFTAGFLKALVWIDFDPELNGFLRWYYSGLHGKGINYFLIGYLQELPLWWLDLVDYAGVVFELTPFLFLLAGRPYWRLWLVAACGFHLSNLLLLNIPFTANFILYMTYVRLDGVFSKLKKWLSNSRFKIAVILIVVFLGLNRFFYFLEVRVSIFEILKNTDIIMHIGFALWTSALLIIGNESIKEFKIFKKKNILQK